MSNIRVLKNISNTPINTNSYGKNFSIKAKGSLTIKDSQADEIAEELLYRFGFLKDITPPPTVNIETKEVIEKNHKGRSVVKKKKVVRKGKGVKKI